MKITNGWISNSSSSSFIIKVKGELNEKIAEDLLRDSYEEIQEEALKENIQKLISASDLYEPDDAEFFKLNEREVTYLEDLKKLGYTLYRVWLSDHSGDEGGVVNATKQQLEEGDYDSEDFLEIAWDYNPPDFVLHCRNCH